MQLTQGATIGTYPVSLASGDLTAFLYATAVHPTSVAAVPSEGGKIRAVAPEKLPSEFPMAELVIPKLVVVKSPALFIHGDDDRNVGFQQTTDLVQKLRAKGDVHIELMIALDEPHAFLLYKIRMEAYNRTFEFIDRFLTEIRRKNEDSPHFSVKLGTGGEND